jgi:hypothetical protein
MAGVSFAGLSHLSDTVFEERENPARTEVSIVPAAAPRPEPQEEILAAVLAARDERDIPAEDDSWIIVDSDGDRPAELAGPDGEQLGELLAAAPSGRSGAAWDGPGGPDGFAEGAVLDVLAPGVALAGCAEDAQARLAGLSDDELIGVLRAWRRQTSWAQARELAAITELARRRPADGMPLARPGPPPASVSEFTAGEVGLALTLTRRSAGAQLDLALALAARSGTAAMLEAGEVDLLEVRLGLIARAWKKQLAAACRHADPGGQLPRPAAGADLLRARAYLALLLGQPTGTPPAGLLPGGAAPAPGTHPAPARTASPPPGCLPPTSRPACASPRPGRPAARCRRWPGRCS